MQSSPVPDAAAEVELIKSIVSRYFSVYETNLSYDAVAFKCQVNKEMLDFNFNKLREELAKHEYIAIISYKGGEHTITVGKHPKVKPRGAWLNMIFLGFTLISTIFAGIILWKGFIGDTSGSFFTIDLILMGTVTFAIPILLILGIHEMGHYYTARKYGVEASLPFFIPAPPPIGTFGAFISIRTPIPDRKTLFDLGVSGPICGFIVAIPIAIIGLLLTGQDARPIPVETGGSMYITLPMIYDFIGLFIPISENYTLHPTAMAGWVGFLVTAINLLPAGSLDGGHIARAVFGTNARYISWIAVLALFLIGIFFSTSWVLFAVLVLFLGMEHAPPLNDITPLTVKRKLVGAGMAVILVTSFVLIPIGINEPDYSFNAELKGRDYANVSIAMDHTFEFMIDSTGNMNTQLVFDLQPEIVKDDIGFKLSYWDNSSGTNVSAALNELMLPVGKQIVTYVTILLRRSVLQDNSIDASITIAAKNASSFSTEKPIHITELSGNYTYTVRPATSSVAPGGTKDFFINLSSDYPSDLDMRLTAIAPAGWSAWVYKDSPANATSRLEIKLAYGASLACTMSIKAPATAISGDTAVISVEITSSGSGRINTAQVTLTVT